MKKISKLMAFTLLFTFFYVNQLAACAAPVAEIEVPSGGNDSYTIPKDKYFVITLISEDVTYGGLAITPPYNSGFNKAGADITLLYSAGDFTFSGTPSWPIRINVEISDCPLKIEGEESTVDKAPVIKIPTKGDPVNLWTGAFQTSVTDLRINGKNGLHFEWKRSYSSNMYYMMRTSEMGSAWTANYLEKLKLKSFTYGGNDYEYIEVNSQEGRFNSYAKLTANPWSTATNRYYYKDISYDAITKEHVIESKEGMKKAFHDESITNSPGRLKRIENRQGDTITFTYTSDKLTSATDTYGRVINFTHANGMIETITDFDGREVKYEYHNDASSTGNVFQLKYVYSPEVSGTSNNNDFDDASGNRIKTTYEYNTTSLDAKKRNQIIKIKDAKDQAYLENEYDDTVTAGFMYNRVIKQIYGNGTFHFDYEELVASGSHDLNDNTTAVQKVITNDPRGIVSEVTMNSKGIALSEKEFTGFAPVVDAITTSSTNRPTGKLRISDPTFYETTYECDTRARTTKMTFPRGNTVTIAYDDTAPKFHARTNVLSTTRADESLGALADIVEQHTYEDSYGFVKTKTDGMGNVTTLFYDYEEFTLGDLNGDGVTTDSVGQAVKLDFATVTVGLSATDNGGSQFISKTYQYNSESKLSKSVNGEGEVTEYTYYPNNDPDGDGATVAGSLDTNTGGFLKEVKVDPSNLNLVTSLKYDAVGNNVEHTDPRNNTTTYEFNALDRLIKVTTPTMSDFAEDGSASYDKIFFYDASGKVESSYAEVKNSKDDAYDSILFLGKYYNKTTYTYNILNNMLTKTVTAKDNQATPLYTDITHTFDYDDSENLTKITYPNSDFDTVEYDERGMIYRKILGDAQILGKSITVFNYNENGDWTEMVHPNTSRTTVQEYDGFDRPTKVEDTASQKSTHWTYNVNSDITSITAKGLKNSTAVTPTNHSYTTIEYDELNRPYQKVFSIIDIQSETTTGTTTSKIRYNKNSRQDRVLSPINIPSTSLYDTANRLIENEDTYGNKTVFTLDANGNTTVVENTQNLNAGGTVTYTTLYAFDELDRLRTIENNLGHVTSYKIDSRGLAHKITDAEDNVQEFQYDGEGRKIAMYSDAATSGQISNTWRFDALGRMTKSIDGNSNETNFAYDSHDRNTLRTNSDASTQVYEYDVESNLTKLTRENGYEIVYGYDDSNRLTSKQFKDDLSNDLMKDVFEYNGLDQLTLVAEDGANEISYESDSRGLVLKHTQKIYDTANLAYFTPKTFNLSYSIMGSHESLEYPSSRIADFNNYNSLELVEDITTNGFTSNHLVDYEYDGYRLAQKDYGNDFQLSITYDAISRVESYLHKNTNDLKTYVGFEFEYDKVNNKLAETFINDGIETASVFELDNAYRTTGFIRNLDTTNLVSALNDFSSVSASDGDDYEVHNVDDANNITLITRNADTYTVTNNNMNETTSIAGVDDFITNAQYDIVGRLTSYERTVDAVKTYYRFTWNARDNLTKAETSTDDVVWSDLASYEYYANGLRAVKNVNGGEHENYYGVAGSIHEIYSVSGPTETLEKEFIYDGVDKPVAMFNDADSNVATGALGGREAYFYHTNTRGDVYALSDESGAVVERYAYSLYGDKQVTTTDSVGSGDVDSLSKSKPYRVGNNLPGNVSVDLSVNLIIFHTSTGDMAFDLESVTSDYNSNYDITQVRYYVNVGINLKTEGVAKNDTFDVYTVTEEHTSTIGNPFMFGGSFKDEETCFMYMRHRYYDSRMRGFISRDPVADDRFGNLYAAFENNSGSHLDPMGLGAGDIGHPDTIIIKGAGTKENPNNDAVIYYRDGKYYKAKYIKPVFDSERGPGHTGNAYDDTNAEVIEPTDYMKMEAKRLGMGNKYPEFAMWLEDNKEWFGDETLDLIESKIQELGKKGKSYDEIIGGILSDPEIQFALAEEGICTIAGALTGTGPVGKKGGKKFLNFLGDYVVGKAKKYRRKLKKALGKDPFGGKGKAHHIFPVNKFDTAAGKKLQKWDIDLNGKNNGVFLPGEAIAGCPATIHSGNHLKSYYTMMEEGINAATTKEGALKFINKIREGLQNGTVKLN